MKLCPFLTIARSGASGEDCIGSQCQLWCEEKDTISDSHGQTSYLKYRSGCGLMPKENRKI